MAVVGNHALWKDFLKREKNLIKRHKIKYGLRRAIHLELVTDLSADAFIAALKSIKVFEKVKPTSRIVKTTIVKNERIRTPSTLQTTYTCGPKNILIPSSTESTIACIPVEQKLVPKTALHIVNSCPQIQPFKLPIFDKSSNSTLVIDKTGDPIKNKEKCTRRKIVEREQPCHLQQTEKPHKIGVHHNLFTKVGNPIEIPWHAGLESGDKIVPIKLERQ
ncbi:hypothetical protein CEXT_604561 [Caerostris extrusa]|uniref:Ribosomal protein S4 n=1 Tax=Caerostris extrusa TaxID=172846 RepID=A0AAV4M407_CAEEX|nr:hypothetical protein CEXT_604561 [Caerostris extrusa]